MKQPASPTIIAIFGITGDLSQQKLIPALFALHKRKALPEKFAVIGFSRSDWGDKELRAFVKKTLAKKKIIRGVAGFIKKFHYQKGDFNDLGTFGDLAEHMIKIENGFGQCTNKLLYIAAPPTYYDTIFTNLANSGLTLPCSEETGWARVLVEKPFGSDLMTAQQLDNQLSLLFKEEQIFRIDHYLGKEMVQDILLFRFSNSFFEPIWNHKYIDRVEIRLHETVGVADRASFYDGVGALRDVGQNHLLQMLSLIAMNNPGSLDPDQIRRERAAVLKSLRPIRSRRSIKARTCRAQYTGYKSHKGTATGTTTETYFRIETEIRNNRWDGVPFILESGKHLPKKETSITVHFHTMPHCLCPPEPHHEHQNMIRFTVQPEQRIDMGFWIKMPGLSYDLEPQALSFMRTPSDDLAMDAYEKVLYSCIDGDQTIFASTQEEQAAWTFITPIVRKWDAVPLTQYTKGTLPNCK